MRKWFDGKRVCIVGGAQALFDKELGKEIDSYDVVCRLNGGVEIVKPESQGTRTDIWGIGKWWTVDHLFDTCKWKNAIHLAPRGEYMRYDPNTREVYRRGMTHFIEGPKIHPVYDYVLPKGIYKQMGKLFSENTAGKVKYMYLQPDIKIPKEIMKASTGLIFTYYASINKPKSITLYGFDWKRTPTWYFGEEEYNNTHQPHDWQWEEWFIKELLDVNVVE